MTTSPDQEVVNTLLPQTSPGPLRQADWNQLTAGTYEAANWQQAPTPTLQSLLKLYDDGMAEAANGAVCRRFNNCLVNGHGYMIIQDWQVGLKRITFRVTWNSGPPGGQVCVAGAPNESCQVTYYEQYSNYWQKP